MPGDHISNKNLEYIVNTVESLKEKDSMGKNRNYDDIFKYIGGIDGIQEVKALLIRQSDSTEIQDKFSNTFNFIKELENHVNLAGVTPNARDEDTSMGKFELKSNYFRKNGGIDEVSNLLEELAKKIGQSPNETTTRNLLDEYNDLAKLKVYMELEDRLEKKGQIMETNIDNSTIIENEPMMKNLRTNMNHSPDSTFYSKYGINKSDQTEFGKLMNHISQRGLKNSTTAILSQACKLLDKDAQLDINALDLGDADKKHLFTKVVSGVVKAQLSKGGVLGM